MKLKMITLSLFVSLQSFAQTLNVTLPASVQNSAVMPFVSSPNFLSLNTPYEPILELRKSIKAHLGFENELNFSRAIFPQGEAHVTVITPPDFNVLSQHLTIQDIESIALVENIQSSDLEILGIGSGKQSVANEERETFFLIVESAKLRRIRLLIYKLFIARGGDPKAWDPAWFFPHITIGFTHGDLHEPVVLKNIKHSYDKRFKVSVSSNE